MDMLDNKKAMIYERDWDCNGAIRMKNATSIERYHELKEQHPDCKECDCFFASSKQQFAEGIKNIRPLKEGEKLHKMDGELFGTKDGMDKFFTYYQDRDNLIKAECNPQEIYFYEYNNHESMISWDGDTEAIKLIIHYWGIEVAKSIKRFNAIRTVEQLAGE